MFNIEDRKPIIIDDNNILFLKQGKLYHWNSNLSHPVKQITFSQDINIKQLIILNLEDTEHVQDLKVYLLTQEGNTYYTSIRKNEYNKTYPLKKQHTMVKRMIRLSYIYRPLIIYTSESGDSYIDDVGGEKTLNFYKTKKIFKLGCSKNPLTGWSSLFLSTDNKVYITSYNHPAFELLMFPPDEIICDITAGVYVTLGVTNKNMIYTWNSVGALISEKYQMEETIVKTVVSSRCKYFAINNKGEVLSWGFNNSCGTLGHDKNKFCRIDKPKKVALFVDKKIKITSLSSDAMTTIFTATDGSLYVCGKNYFGIQLYKKFKLDPQEEKIPKLQRTLFKRQQRKNRVDLHIKYEEE